VYTLKQRKACGVERPGSARWRHCGMLPGRETDRKPPAAAMTPSALALDFGQVLPVSGALLERITDDDDSVQKASMLAPRGAAIPWLGESASSSSSTMRVVDTLANKRRALKRDREGAGPPELPVGSSADQQRLLAEAKRSKGSDDPVRSSSRKRERAKRFDGVSAAARAGIGSTIVGPLGSGLESSKAMRGTSSAAAWNPHAAAVLKAARQLSGGSSEALEGVDLDDLPAIVGTSLSLERKYFRGVPDPKIVRPPPVLVKSLEHVCSLWIQEKQPYLWVWEQLKAIRQDLVLQRVVSPLTVRAYEAHARIALDVGDANEFNQCQTQLMYLYHHPELWRTEDDSSSDMDLSEAEEETDESAARRSLPEWLKVSHTEFVAYRLLYYEYSGATSDATHLLLTLSDEQRSLGPIKHALAVRHALAMGQYFAFLGPLAEAAPLRSLDVMRLILHRVRLQALASVARAYRPGLPLHKVARLLGFTSTWRRHRRGAGVSFEGLRDWSAGKWLPATDVASPALVRDHDRMWIEECRLFVQHCGGVVTVGADAELVLDCKESNINPNIRPKEELEANPMF
jgi:hypothetical protein